MITTHIPGLSSAGFLEPAVYPAQTGITLVTPHLPWQISVPASNAKYVTVADVLNTIYRTLRMNATPGEFEALRKDKLMQRVSGAYTQRCKRLRGHRGYEQERKEGIKRVDFLIGYHQFQGIVPTDGALDVWQLTISGSDLPGLASSREATKPKPRLDKPSQAKSTASGGLGLVIVGGG
ncbi:hypothetical protein MVEN_02247100 [Mycena venus]|uniref:DUF6699 domain-containing protein n=1 Tax=Mycena venus TaxID=2733690 RepID=A0A8H6X6F7_9AGAR|nr:hypothetical protein MVEN_02247100 [Mycena venus]